MPKPLETVQWPWEVSTVAQCIGFNTDMKPHRTPLADTFSNEAACQDSVSGYYPRSYQRHVPRNTGTRGFRHGRSSRRHNRWMNQRLLITTLRRVAQQQADASATHDSSEMGSRSIAALDWETPDYGNYNTVVRLGRKHVNIAPGSKEMFQHPYFSYWELLKKDWEALEQFRRHDDSAVNKREHRKARKPTSSGNTDISQDELLRRMTHRQVYTSFRSLKRLLLNGPPFVMPYLRSLEQVLTQWCDTTADSAHNDSTALTAGSDGVTVECCSNGALSARHAQNIPTAAKHADPGACHKCAEKITSHCSRLWILTSAATLAPVEEMSPKQKALLQQEPNTLTLWELTPLHRKLTYRLCISWGLLFHVISNDSDNGTDAIKRIARVKPSKVILLQKPSRTSTSALQQPKITSNDILRILTSPVRKL